MGILCFRKKKDCALSFHLIYKCLLPNDLKKHWHYQSVNKKCRGTRGGGSESMENPLMQNLPKSPIFDGGLLNFFFKWLHIFIANAFPYNLVENICRDITAILCDVIYQENTYKCAVSQIFWRTMGAATAAL